MKWKRWWVGGQRTRFLCSYLLGCTACFLLIGFRTAAIKQWMQTFDLDTSSIGHISTAWLVGKCVGLAIVWSNRLGRYDVCVMVTLLAGASWWTRQSIQTRDLFIGYGLEGCGAVIFGWWAPVILMRVDPTRFPMWSSILSSLNILSVCAGGALYGALEPSLSWRGIWMVRSVTLSVSSVGILLNTYSENTNVLSTTDPVKSHDVESISPLVEAPAIPHSFNFKTGGASYAFGWSWRRMLYYGGTLVSVTATIAVLETFSYWGMLYLEREYHYEHTPDLQVKSGILLTIVGGGAILGQTLVVRWKGGSERREKRLHQQFMLVGQMVCAIICVVLAQTRDLTLFAVLFLGGLTPFVCLMLSSCCYLMGTVADPSDTRGFTIVMEVSLLLLTQWMSPILFGYVMDNAIYATFYIFAMLFGLGSIGALTVTYVTRSLET